MEHFDFIALGGGNAGLTASHAVAAAGKKVALIDPTPIGGLCSLRGCNPKKVLVRASEVLHEVRGAAEHGVHTGDVHIDWNAVIERKHRFTDLVTARTEQALQRAGVAYIQAVPRFLAPDRLQADGRAFTFDGLLIATGSTPRRLTFPGAEHVLTSDVILELRHVPKTLVVIGAGVVGFEFGQMFARLGSAVHMLLRGATALDDFDRDMVRKLVEYSQSLGMVFHKNVGVTGVEARGESSYSVTLDNGATLHADVILNAAGRPPAITELNLQAAGVDTTPRGVVVNEYLRSPGNSRIFAAGDARGQKQLSPVASYEGALAAHNFLHGDSKKVDVSAVPSAVFTVPPLAAVGLTEQQARARGAAYEVARQDMSDWTVFRIAGLQPAHAKLISAKPSGRILGAHLYALGADEMINLYALAVRLGLTTAQLGDMVYIYPSYTSALQHL